MDRKETAREEFGASEGQKIVERHREKLLNTVEVLMEQMNMMYFFERIKETFIEPNLDELYKLMARCLKLYQMISDFMNIFSMLDRFYE